MEGQRSEEKNMKKLLRLQSVLLEEIVKDADVLDFYQYGYDVARKEQQDRLEALLGHKVAGLKFSE